MEIINGSFSSCCDSSILPIYGTDKKPFHYKCNKCKKECEKIVKPYIEVTPKGKYKIIS